MPMTEQARRSAPIDLEGAARSVLIAILSFGLCCSLVGSAWAVFKYGVTPAMIGLMVGWLLLALIAVALVKSGSAWLFAAAAAVISLRLFIFWTTGGEVVGSDPRIYASMARGVADGAGLVTNIPGFPPFRALFPPLYPLLQAVPAALGLPAIVLNTIIDFFTALLLFRIANLFGAGRMGLAAGYLYLIWPSMVMGAALPSKEGLACLLFSAAIYAIIRLWLGVGRWNLPMLGASIGLLALTQPAFATLPPLLTLPLLQRLGWRPYLRAVVPAGAIAVAVLSPWVIRNYIVLHAFIPMTTSYGINLYDTNCGSFLEMPAEVRRMNEPAMTSAAGQLAMRCISADTPMLIVAKLKQAVVSLGLDHAHIENYQRLAAPPFDPLAFTLAVQVFLVGLWAAALRQALRSGLGIMQVLILLTFAHFALVNVWFQFGQRHRIVLIPLLLAFVAIASAQRSTSRQAARDPATVPAPAT